MATTRFSERTGIVYHRDTRSGLWAHFDCNGDHYRKVGPWYKTKEELLADHEDYLIRAGWMRPD